jgi:hypothetical protein
MSGSDLHRWCGVAAILAGVVFILGWLLSLANSLSPLLLSLLILAEILALVGLVGFHILQKGSYGRIGRVGFYVAVVGFLVEILAIALLSPGSVASGRLLAIGYLGQVVGLVLYGAATLQAKVLPRWCGIGFIIVAPLAYILGSFGNVLFGLIWLALGYALWSQKETSERQSTRVS